LIYLTDSALRYAADICRERPGYVVIIYVARNSEYTDISRKMHTYLKNKHARVSAANLSWRAEFENGSRILALYTNANARGHRCHLAIVSDEVSDAGIDTIVRPSEVLDHFEAEPPEPAVEAEDTDHDTDWANNVIFENDIPTHVDEVQARVPADVILSGTPNDIAVTASGIHDAINQAITQRNATVSNYATVDDVRDIRDRIDELISERERLQDMMAADRHFATSRINALEELLQEYHGVHIP